MSRHLPALRLRAILRALNKAGFFVHHVSGGLYILKHPGQPGRRVTLSGGNLAGGTHIGGSTFW
jgi:predicted RNA binding protein YcfA (HicA-like mRNA interferase family)